MYLQRIELQGFQSFATKTVIEFPPPRGNAKSCQYGITAIVGPNGSGKSNVVDAVRWVLGEQSLKLLRGKKATDIIFAGSAQKSQMGLAEVSLYLNNEDGAAPIDFSEIVITRKLYRDGSSEYLLNKSEVRLFDIVMLLAKANFGQNTYSVIGQGMVDKIVSYSGPERKEFFDEATGVKQFQIKRDKSVNKLKRSREHSAQVQAVLTELDPHLKNLTRQVERLRKRQAIEAELKDIQVNYYGHVWLQLTDSYQTAASAYTEQEKQKLKLETEIEELQEEFNKLSIGSSRSGDFDQLQQEHTALTAQKNELLKELTILRGKLDLEYSKIGKQDLSWLENKKDELEQRVMVITESITAITNAAALKQQQLKTLEQQLNQLNAELTVLQNNLHVAQEDFYNNRSTNRHNAGMDAARAVISQRQNIVGVHGSVGDISRVEDKYEAALAAAAGNRLFAVVVDNDQSAVESIRYLKENRLSPVTFLPMKNLQVRGGGRDSSMLNRPGVVGYAIDLVSFDPKFSIIFEHIFGSTLVVETAEDAKALGVGRQRMVTLDGDLFEATGVIKGGYQSKGFLAWLGLSGGGQTSNVKHEDLQRHKASVDSAYRRRDELIELINNTKIEIRLEDNRRADFELEQDKIKSERTKLERELKEHQLSPDQRDAHLAELDVRKKELDQELISLSEQEQKIRHKLDDFNQAEEQKKQAIFAIQQNMHGKQIELNQVTNILNEYKIELAKIDTRKEDVLNSMRQDLGEEYRPHTKEIDEKFDTEEALGRISRLKKQLELIGGTDPEIEKEYEEVKTRFDHLSQQNQDLIKAITDLEKVVVELDKLIKKQFDDEFAKINRDFSRYFKQLFDGGSAKLLLAQREVTEAEAAREEVMTSEDGTEIVETETEKVEKHIEDQSSLATMGIEIEACPPGKKIKNINVLSGGEKTMTALALICAIISNNPSPFILFDEVDAALDESNSSKFSAIVEELSHKTQFIIITHNRAIMSRANVLYGVTMQGDGISRLIGLKLDQAEAMAES